MPKCFSWSLYPLIFPPALHEGFKFSTSLIILGFFVHLFGRSDPIECEVVSHCGLEVYLMTSNDIHFSWAYWPCIYFLWRNVCLITLPFKKNSRFFFFQSAFAYLEQKIWLENTAGCHICSHSIAPFKTSCITGYIC